MFKMMIVLLALAFTVAACNKNNSKADRVKKNPALPGVPAGDQKPVDKNPADTAPQSDENLDEDKDKPGTRKELPPGSVGNSGSPSSPAPDSNSTAPGASQGAPANSSSPEVTTSVVQQGETAPAQPAEKATESKGVKITSYPSMGYSLAEMTTEKGKNSLITSALLNFDNEQSRRARLHCFDAKVAKESNTENMPELIVFPQSEVLVEVKVVGTAADEITAGLREETSNITHLLTTCQGPKDAYTEATKDYDYRKLKAEQSQNEFLRVDSRDRDMAEISVMCSRNNISAKMDRVAGKTEKIINNRVTLSPGSKIMLARPIDYAVDKKGTKLKAAKKVKDYSIIECE